MKTTLIALAAATVWLAPTASADPQDQSFLSILNAHKVKVDRNTAIAAGHIACSGITSGVSRSTVEDSLLKQFPTTINGAEYWIVDAAQQTYCPPSVPPA